MQGKMRATIFCLGGVLLFSSLLLEESPVKERVTIHKVEVPYSLEKIPKSLIPQGWEIVLQEGEPGLREVAVKTIIRQGKIINRKVVSERTVKVPLKKVALIGNRKAPDYFPVPQRMYVERTLVMKATAYYPGPECTAPFNDGFTAAGWEAKFGMVAVDPKVIPLGTIMYIEGYGYGLAADVGAAIKGKRLDLCFNTLKEARRYGRRWVRVYILYSKE